MPYVALALVVVAVVGIAVVAIPGVSQQFDALARLIGVRKSGLNVIMMWELHDGDGNLIATGNSNTGTGPLSVVWQAGPPSGDVPLQSSYYFIWAPIPEVTVSNLDGTNAKIVVTSTMTATYGGSSITLTSLESTFPSTREYTYSVSTLKAAPTKTLDAVGGKKLGCDVLIANAPPVGSSKTVNLQCTVTTELWVDGVKVSTDTKTTTASMTIKNTVGGTITISSINFGPIFFQ
jgi:hypothetical protein